MVQYYIGLCILYIKYLYIHYYINYIYCPKPFISFLLFFYNVSQRSFISVHKELSHFLLFLFFWPHSIAWMPHTLVLCSETFRLFSVFYYYKHHANEYPRASIFPSPWELDHSWNMFTDGVKFINDKIKHNAILWTKLFPTANKMNCTFLIPQILCPKDWS